MGIFFDDPKPRITPLKWKKVREILYGAHDFTTKELDEVEEIFRGDMDEKRDIDKGIDTDELVKGIEYMRGHMNLHHISLQKIDALEVEMTKSIASY
jgi:hypothetical protein